MSAERTRVESQLEFVAHLEVVWLTLQEGVLQYVDERIELAIRCRGGVGGEILRFVEHFGIRVVD